MSFERPCPECGELLAPYARSCACGWKQTSNAKPKPAPGTNCVCGKPGLIKRDGVWQCADCCGYVRVQQSSGKESGRARWYRERGLPYEPPRLFDMPPFRCIGRAAERVMREPGQDDEERDVG